MNHSTLYPYAVFLHVLGAMALVAFYGLEWATLHRLRRDPDPTQVAVALSPLGMGQKLIVVSMPILLLSGLYLVWAAWAWTTPWIVTGFASMILLGFLGGSVTGRHVGALLASNGTDVAVRLPSMWTSFVIRVSVLIAVIFLMCTKPGLPGSLAALAISLVAGKLLARGRREPAVASAS